MSVPAENFKSFWKRPEGVTGLVVLILVLLGGGYLLLTFLPFLIALTQNILALSLMLLVLAAVTYLVFDTKMRIFVWYMYQNLMRWLTGLFIQIDPIKMLQNYVADLRENLKKMNRQINKLRGQMHLLQEQIHKNNKAIASNLNLANEAKEKNERSAMILKSRKAGRLKDSNLKLEDLYGKMEVLYRVLVKMYENSEILVEDVSDQVHVKEQERAAIHAGHSAMQSAMNMISGNTDKRVVFDRALEAVADDVAGKVGEMEQFMELSDNFMSSIDLQNGVFEERGLELLEKWEKQGDSLLLGEDKQNLIDSPGDPEAELRQPAKHKRKEARKSSNQYDIFFD